LSRIIAEFFYGPADGRLYEVAGELFYFLPCDPDSMPADIDGYNWKVFNGSIVPNGPQAKYRRAGRRRVGMRYYLVRS
jgi:hypothetical protein